MVYRFATCMPHPINAPNPYVPVIYERNKRQYDHHYLRSDKF